MYVFFFFCLIYSRLVLRAWHQKTMNNFKHVDELVKTAQNTRKSKDFQKVADCFEPLIKSTAYRYARTYKNTPYELQDFDSVINYIFTKLIVSFD
ncbi:MAG: hypothetical protein DRQ78_01255 [Epsilonproteobacteria bacterium]|nr:MAG: hypothetical protein DRQ78_01255 [Campylobacterota bacterium]